MVRVYVICEGQTEETFIKEVLYDLFLAKSIYLQPVLIGKPGHKGGNFTFGRLLADIKPLLGDSEAYCTTLFDFYGLPNDFPGKVQAQSMANSKDKANCIMQALVEALQETTINPESLRRFIPYIQMYEFEGLLFSDCIDLAFAIGQPQIRRKLQNIRDEFSSPEDINDSYITAPSKRLRNLYPGYDKPIHGSLASLEIGIDTIRKECKLFDQWLSQIEGLALQNQE
jgi:Domain of unknown function (DUF4276)